ncbi:hypothetical protein X943_003248 [Babesia divergens]|uniref:HORMA domain-containing protein n=1 Tax=Babesia divergens TaxID=32595 RepID=A0AAD9GDQ2_BABDI|nr:hypothetical protein X943_003248 [Babesia divergens]
MYRSGYLDLICELKYLLEVLIHTVFYHYRIYPQGSFQKHRRFGIIVRCQEKPEVIRYVQQLTEVLYLLLKDKVLNACSIVLTRKDSGETLATYNLQVERHLYMTTISHFDITSLRDEFAKALMKFETRAHAPEGNNPLSLRFK